MTQLLYFAFGDKYIKTSALSLFIKNPLKLSGNLLVPQHSTVNALSVFSTAVKHGYFLAAVK